MRHPPHFKTLGILLLLAGIFIQYRIRRRKFYRRRPSGSEGFRSYESSVIIRFLEGIFGLVSWVMILLGGYMLAISYM